MGKLIVTLAVFILFTGAASAQDIGHHPNEIGVYITETPTGVADAILTATEGGVYRAHLVLSNPVNEHTGDPITTLGYFEFVVRFPAGWEIKDEFIHCDNGFIPRNSGVFACDGPHPVMDGYATLVSFYLETTTAPAGEVFLSPNASAATIPGHMVISDALDRTYSRAYPVSGDYARPVMGINMAVVPGEDAGWGKVKALFR